MARVLFTTVTSHAASSTAFGDRLAAHVAERESQLVLGLDPDPMALWPGIQAPAHGSIAERAAAMAQAHCAALIDAAGPACVAVKLQLARFEALGWAGWRALEATAAHARESGLLVIADGKRGDIDVSALAYAQALMGATDTPVGAVDGLGADMVTVNPLMGADALQPFIATARAVRGGVLVLVRTSNPGAADIQDLPLARAVEMGGRGEAGGHAVEMGGRREAGGHAVEMGGRGEAGRSGRRDEVEQASEMARNATNVAGAVWERIAMFVDRLGGAVASGQASLGDVGAVMGATAPDHVARARELMPHAVFLLPGVGAQGGRVEDLAAAFAPGRAGGLITASRSIAGAHLQSAGDPADAARAEAERLRALAWALV